MEVGKSDVKDVGRPEELANEFIKPQTNHGVVKDPMWGGRKRWNHYFKKSFRGLCEPACPSLTPRTKGVPLN